jgi:lysozyme
LSSESILRTEEGKSLKLYKDTRDIWTIGIGYNIQQRGLPDDIVEELFRRDMLALRANAQHIPEYASLDPVRQGIIERMVFQMGADGVLAFTDFRAALARKDYTTAASEMLDSKWAKKDAPARARREAQRMIRGIE